MPNPYGEFNLMGLPDPNMVALNSGMAGPVQMPSMRKVPRRGVGGLWDRLQQGVAGYPDHLAGMVSERDVAGARNQGLLSLGASLLESSGPSLQPTSLGQAVGRGMQAGMQTYQGNIDRLGQQAAGRQEMDMNRMKMDAFKQEQAKMQQISAKRQAVLQQFPMPQTGSMEDMEKWITQTMPHFVEMGDDDTVRSLTEAYKTIAAQKGGTNSKFYEVDAGDHIELRDPKTNKVVERIPKGIAPRDVAAGAQTRAEMSEARRFQKEDNLRGDFNKDTTNMRQVAAKMRGAIQETDRAMAGDGAAQVNMLYAFINSMDPASAVREGEIGLARAAAAPYDQAKALLDKYLNNESVIVPPGLIRQMSELMSRRYDGYRSQVQERIDYYTPQADAYSLESGRLFTGIPALDRQSSQGGSAQQQPGPWKDGYVMPGANVRDKIGGIR
jgi:hypothetical protein